MSGAVKFICRLSIVVYIAYFIMRFINLFNYNSTAWDFVALFATILPYVLIYLFLFKIANVFDEVEKLRLDNMRLDTECKRLNAKYETLKKSFLKKLSIDKNDLEKFKDDLKIDK